MVTQDLAHGGKVRQDGGYALLEGTASAFRPDLWFTLTGFYGWGEAKIERNYLNAGLPDASRASPNVSTWAVRGRVDWQDALRFANAAFAPYVDLSHIRARVGTYTESGGSFPARLDGRTESATMLRLGLNANWPLAERVRLLGTLEGVHQFDDRAKRTTGHVLGLFDFSLAGAQNKRHWLRVGLGADAHVGSVRRPRFFWTRIWGKTVSRERGLKC